MTHFEIKKSKLNSQPCPPRSPSLTVEVDGHGVGLLLFDLLCGHAVLHGALEHGVLVCPGGLHVQGALDGEESGRLLHHRGNHVGP